MIYMFRKEIKKWHSVLWVVFLSLGLGGLSSIIFYRIRHPRDMAVAHVNGAVITLKRFQQEFVRMQTRLEYLKQYARAQGVPVELFLSLYGFANPKQSALDSCVQQELIDELGTQSMVLDPEYYNNALFVSLPAYLRKEDGTIDVAMYKRHLAQMRTTIADYEDDIEQAEQRSLVSSLIRSSAYVPAYQVYEQATQNNAEKKFNFISLPLSRFVGQARDAGISQEELAAYFKKHASRYRIPEKKSARYWRINSEHFEAQIIVSDESIERYYGKNKHDLFRIPPKVQLRQIFLKRAGMDASEGIRRAQQLRAELATNKDEFANKAKAVSDDSKTATNGGFVDFFEKGTYDPAFERAAFRLREVGEISPVVTTDDGYYILQLVKRIASTSKPIGDVRSHIVEALKAKKALRQMAFEVKQIAKGGQDKLNEAIKELKLKEVKTGLLTRADVDAKHLEAVLAERLFAPGAEMGKIGFVPFEDDFLLYQIAEVEQSVVPELKEVEKQVRDDHFSEEGKKLQRKMVRSLESVFFAGDRSLAKVAADSNTSISSTTMLSREQIQDQGPLKKILAAAFAMTASGQLYTGRVEDDYYLVELLENKVGTAPTAEELSKQHSELKARLDQSFLDGFIASLRRTAKIEVDEKLLQTNN